MKKGSAVSEMEVISNCSAMQAKALELKRAGKTIAVVPTMGYLHDGHLSLMDAGRELADVLITTIFVNPTQFGPNEDLSRYPRDEAGDLAKCSDHAVDIVFTPSPDDIYPPGYQTYVTVEEVSQGLCGASRPVHFRGVATICCKLFNLTAADYAVFGEKDYQQVTVIKRMVADLNIPVKIVGMPLVREADGLAMSSRNAYLSAEQRQIALVLSKALEKASEMVAHGQRDVAALIAAMTEMIESQPQTKIDYLGIYDTQTLKELETVEESALAALAVWVGKTRLIDNCVLKSGG